LTERAQDLVNNTLQDRQRYLAAQQEALKNTSVPERKKYLQSIINNDDLNQADDLMRQSSTNQWGGIVNRMLSSVDLAGVASGNYIGAAAETVISQLYALADRDMAIEERRALRAISIISNVFQRSAECEILRQVEGSREKKSVLIKKQLARGDEACKGELERALFIMKWHLSSIPIEERREGSTKSNQALPGAARARKRGSPPARKGLSPVTKSRT
jgi:hypothetical protein